MAKAMHAFEGFSPAAMRFLRDLAKHNERTWFEPRKETFVRECQEPLRALAGDLASALAKAKVPLAGNPKSAFRIYRDVRFSPDKSPYKTNLGVYLTRGGSKNEPGGLYVHIAPKECFAGVGFYLIDKELLGRWRAAMATEPRRFQTLLRTLEKNGLPLEGHGEGLKRMPRGFESMAESPIAGYFKRGSFMVSEELDDKDVGSRAVVERAVALAKRAKPLLEYGWALT